MKRCVACTASFDAGEWRCPRCGFEPQRIDGLLSFHQPTGVDGFDPDAFDRLARTESSSFWFRSRNRLIAWALAEYFPDARSLLEIGCGTGYVLAGLEHSYPELGLTGAELYASGLRHAAVRAPNADFLQLDAREMPFAEEFDVVGAFDVLEHIDDDEAVLAGMHEATKPGGGILVTVPQHRWLWSASDDYAEHKRRYTRAELSGKVASAGFAVRRVTSFVSLLLPLMAASRLAEQLSRSEYDPGREHAAAGRAAKPLELIADFERRLIERGLNLPAGGSLLLVGIRQ